MVNKAADGRDTKTVTFRIGSQGKTIPYNSCDKHQPKLQERDNKSCLRCLYKKIKTSTQDLRSERIYILSTGTVHCIIRV